MSARPTKAQRNLLEKAERYSVMRYPLTGGVWVQGDLGAFIRIRATVFEAAIRHGWLQIDVDESAALTSYYCLTEAGRAALRSIGEE